jgi:hypothetical protein
MGHNSLCIQPREGALHEKGEGTACWHCPLLHSPPRPISFASGRTVHSVHSLHSLMQITGVCLPRKKKAKKERPRSSNLEPATSPPPTSLTPLDYLSVTSIRFIRTEHQDTGIGPKSDRHDVFPIFVTFVAMWTTSSQSSIKCKVKSTFRGLLICNTARPSNDRVPLWPRAL